MKILVNSSNELTVQAFSENLITQPGRPSGELIIEFAGTDILQDTFITNLLNIFGNGITSIEVFDDTNSSVFQSTQYTFFERLIRSLRSGGSPIVTVSLYKV